MFSVRKNKGVVFQQPGKLCGHFLAYRRGHGTSEDAERLVDHVAGGLFLQHGGGKSAPFAHPLCGTFKYAAVEPGIGVFPSSASVRSSSRYKPSTASSTTPVKRPEILCRHLPGAGVLAFADVSPYSKKLFALAFLTPVIGILYLSAKYFGSMSYSCRSRRSISRCSAGV